MEISIFLFKRSLADQHPIINLASSKTLPAANQVGPRDTSGHETLPVLELLDTSSLEVFGHVWPWDKSSPQIALASKQAAQPLTIFASSQLSFSAFLWSSNSSTQDLIPPGIPFYPLGSSRIPLEPPGNSGTNFKKQILNLLYSQFAKTNYRKVASRSTC